jgi:hypothetical protein
MGIAAGEARYNPATQSNRPCRLAGPVALKYTPAGAGKTPEIYEPVAVDDGSPPLARGIRRGCGEPWSSTRVHPRRCGEDADPEAVAVLHTGSPPRVRGHLFDH